MTTTLGWCAIATWLAVCVASCRAAPSRPPPGAQHGVELLAVPSPILAPPEALEVVIRPDAATVAGLAVLALHDASFPRAALRFEQGVRVVAPLVRAVRNMTGPDFGVALWLDRSVTLETLRLVLASMRVAGRTSIYIVVRSPTDFEAAVPIHLPPVFAPPSVAATMGNEDGESTSPSSVPVPPAPVADGLRVEVGARHLAIVAGTGPAERRALPRTDEEHHALGRHFVRLREAFAEGRATVQVTGPVDLPTLARVLSELQMFCETPSVCEDVFSAVQLQL